MQKKAAKGWRLGWIDQSTCCRAVNLLEKKTSQKIKDNHRLTPQILNCNKLKLFIKIFNTEKGCRRLANGFD